MKRQQQQGAAGENQAALALARLGIEMIVKVETPIRIVRGQVIRHKKADADITGIYPATGQRVLAEVKTHDENTLPWSMLRPHQPARLTENVRCNGLSFLIWVHSAGVFVMSWPVPDFWPGSSIALDYAKRFDLLKEIY
jgi:penicillin-binding protein-related factor A (putative recombinase)